jgi:hypothetical protein
VQQLNINVMHNVILSPIPLDLLVQKIIEANQGEKKQIQVQPDVSERIFTRKEAANHFKVAVTTIDNWTRSGRLKRRCVGGRVYFTQEDIDRALVTVQ